ncbi:MAG: sigma-70 family RNA polymerase sigma factor [Planctomycetales bacterium]|nr:sigma-70 family RNA polymerase sigma factor [Planctomycetales bacterium]
MSLISRLSKREEQAWQRAAQLYGPLVYRWARRWGLQANDSEDLVQEVFQVLASGIDKFERQAGTGSFRRWLWGISRNKASDHFRKLAKDVQAAGGTAANEAMQNMASLPPEEYGEGDDFDVDASLVHRALALLESDFQPQTWRAFWRMAIDRQSAADVAEELGMTKKGVRQAKYRVLQRLRAELDDEIDGDAIAAIS